MFIFRQITIVLLGLLLTVSCATIRYSPQVNLQPVKETINKKVKIEKFIDNSPVADKMNPFTGFSLTNNEILQIPLDTAITELVENDFRNNKLFSTIGDSVLNPDYVLKGEIKKFRAASVLSAYGITTVGLYIAGTIAEIAYSNPSYFLSYIPTTGFLFAAPARRNKIEIEIQMSLYTAEGVLIKNYTGKSSYKKTVYLVKNNAREVPKLTNEALSNVIMQIREEIEKDILEH